MIQLFVKHGHNKLQPIHVNCKDTISTIKQRYNMTELSLYHDKLLEDHHTVEHYQLIDNDTIQATGKLQGGLPIADVMGPMFYALGINKYVNELIDRKVMMANTIVDQKMNFGQRMGEFIKKIAEFVKTMITVAKFFPIITLVLMVLASLGKPMEFLLMIVALFFVVIIYVIYSVLNMPPFIYCVMAVWFFIFDVIPFLVYCAVFGVVFGIISLVCLFLTILNTVFFGSLKNLVLCQTSPSDWYKVSNYELDNKWDRSMMCNRPCFSGYAPDSTGTMCAKTPKGYPPYCPQAEIMRIYSQHKSDSAHIFPNYNDTSDILYLTMKPEEREKQLKTHYMHKRAFRETCNKKFKDYDPITLNICSSTDIMEANKHLTPKELDRLKQVCKEAYCAADRNYPFCSKVSGFKEDDQNELIKKVLKIITYTIVFILILTFAFELLYKKN